MKLDTKDKQILDVLKENSRLSVHEIGLRVNLTNNPCWRRIKRLEESGAIKKYTIELDHAALGMGTVAFVSLKLERHEASWLHQLSAAVEEMPEIIECHRMAGDVDYLLKILVKDLRHYDEVYQALISKVPGLADVSSTFSMEELKSMNQ